MGGINTKKKIELLEYNESNSSISTPNSPNSQGGLSIRAAKILQNIENHTIKGNFCLMSRLN